jgi:CxxC motif-containing protein (DUF1111 family)
MRTWWTNIGKIEAKIGEKIGEGRLRRGLIGLGVGVGAVVVGWAVWGSAGPSADAETIAQGRDLFLHEWQVNDKLAGEGDGLGPVFNARSCAACHTQGGVGGAGPNSANVINFQVHPRKGEPRVIEGVVHTAAVTDQCRETQHGVRQKFPVVPGETRTLSNNCVIHIPGFDPLRFESINTPALFGLGLIDDIPDRSIAWNRTRRNMAAVGSELRGQMDHVPAGRVRELSGGRVGKFGWKGQFASVEQFVATACAVEIGLSNPLVKQHKARLHGEDLHAQLDLDATQFAALVAYVESLPRPEQVLPSDEHGRLIAEKGAEVFNSVGCAECHIPDIGGVTGVYSDFLLYSLEGGDDPDDNGGSGYGPQIDPVPWPENVPEPEEWHTPPLWGVADSAPYFHDGRSPTLSDAIERHGGDARLVRERYRNLSPEDRTALVRFLQTLQAPRNAEPVAAAGDKERAGE